MSDKIQPLHLQRKALVYVRQSSAFQVENNRESQLLQYAMRERLEQLGWRDIEIIDEDLGRTASGAVGRSGFERLVAEVSLGKVGAVAARELSRFARNSQDWQKLVDVCRWVQTLLIDHEAIYDSRNGNDRLLLGLKGSLSEYELDLLRQRSLEARRQKARRGELILRPPAGFVRDVRTGYALEPDQRVQEAIRLVFQKFDQLGSVRQVLLWFLEHDLQLPVRENDSEEGILWKRPRYCLLYRILTHPIYAGAYVYGRTGERIVSTDGLPLKRWGRKKREDWEVLIADHHEGYISWQHYEQIQQMIAHNTNQFHSESHGAAKRGASLLAGLLRCKRCGRKLTVLYTGRERNVQRYACCRGQLDNGQPRCLSFGGDRVNQRVGEEILQLLEPKRVEIARLAFEQHQQGESELVKALELDLEAARYRADRHARQFNRADPENRLVVAELESRWNQALEQVRSLENRLAGERQKFAYSATLHAHDFSQLASQLGQVWHDCETDIRIKKRIARTLIEEIVVDADGSAGMVDLWIHWKGGQHSHVQVRRRKRGQNRLHTDTSIVETVRTLSHIQPDELIAACLNRNGLKTGKGNRWTTERVTSLRSKRKIEKYTQERKDANGWMTLTDASKYIGVSTTSLRAFAESKKITYQHPLPDGPWIFNRKDLEKPETKEWVKRIKQRTARGAEPEQPQLNIDISGTCPDVAV